MPNLAGNAYGLTTLCPIINNPQSERSNAVLLRGILDALPTGERSPFAAVPNTYLCRVFVLDNVVYQGLDVVKAIPVPIPAAHDRLKSAYLVFISEFHGPDLQPYLWAMWDTAQEAIRQIWQYCVGFSEVYDAGSFAKYIQRCQLETTFYFNGSNDESLAEQLKGLYLKQELAKFAFEHQNASPEQLQADFFDFVRRTQPEDLQGPTWRPGATSLEIAVVGEAVIEPLTDAELEGAAPPQSTPPLASVEPPAANDGTTAVAV